MRFGLHQRAAESGLDVWGHVLCELDSDHGTIEVHQVTVFQEEGRERGDVAVADKHLRVVADEIGIELVEYARRPVTAAQTDDPVD